MNELPNRLLRLRCIFLVMAIFLIMLPTLPIRADFNHIFIPDLLLIMTFTWVMQRPDVIGPITITIVFLFADFILQRPPGLWAVIVLLAATFLGMRSARFKEIFFIYEWATVSVIIVFCYLTQYILMRLTFLAIYDLKLLTTTALTTIFFYPVFTWVFRPMLKKPGLHIKKKLAAEVSE